MKELRKKTGRLVKGSGRAVVLSILIHAGLFLIATSLVVFTVITKQEKEFEAPPPKERPKMKLKKPRVRIKKSSRPKSTQRIVTRSKRSSMPQIELPEMGGIGDGLGGDMMGLELMPDLADVSVLGGYQSIGNDFEGTLYDLKRNRRGGMASMDRFSFQEILAEYCRKGWNNHMLDKYYQAPKKLYTTHFTIPPIISPMAPDQFGSPETESYFFFLKYEGKLVYKEDIKFRFWGVGDAYVVVNVAGREVLINGWNGRLVYLNHWQTKYPTQSDTYYLGNQQMKVGDWIELKAGEPVEMKVIFGEWVGGQVSCILLVEVEGEEYPTSRQGGPLLPAFKTEEFTLDQIEEIYKHLPEGECTLTNGPVFRDF